LTTAVAIRRQPPDSHDTTSPSPFPHPPDFCPSPFNEGPEYHHGKILELKMFVLENFDGLMRLFFLETKR